MPLQSPRVATRGLYRLCLCKRSYSATYSRALRPQDQSWRMPFWARRSQSSGGIVMNPLDSSITSSNAFLGQGQAVTLTATSSVDVHGTGRWLEIYDLTAGSRITYCTHGTSCTTTVKETTGGVHKIVGYVTGKPEAVSDPIFVTWLDVRLSATSIGPKAGGTVYLTATTNADLGTTPWVVGIYDDKGHLVDPPRLACCCAAMADGIQDGYKNPDLPFNEKKGAQIEIDRGVATRVPDKSKRIDTYVKMTTVGSAGTIRVCESAYVIPPASSTSSTVRPRLRCEPVTRSDTAAS